MYLKGQQFSYMTPPPSNKRTSPQDHLPVYYSDLQTTTRISPKPKYFDSPSPPKPQFSYFNSPHSPPPPPCPGPGLPNTTMASNLEDDSGFESLVTNVSDSGDQFLPPINRKLFGQVPFVPGSCHHQLTETLVCPGWRSSSLSSCSLLTLRLPPPLHQLRGEFRPHKAVL